ncbi:MAG: tetratricopeptide repeat protein [Phycisphaerae bacterium]|nr:tetratricopeptide repeat protein [Phycisphaerae bacterium]
MSCVILLGLIELSLWLCRYGYPASPIIRYSSECFDGYVDNAKFSWRFFHRNLAREFEPFTLPPIKGNNTRRIFVCGASAAQGIPDGSFSFARIFEVMLRHAYPDTTFEVINTGMTAINSHVVLPIVRDCARFEPDLFIVYLGNNEVVGPHGAGTVFAGMAEQLWLIRAGIALKTTRTGQFLNDAAAAMRSDDNAMKSWGGMQMFLDKQIRLADHTMPIVYKHFQKNLEDIRDTAVRSGATVVFCTVASNLKDCPPFASLHRPDLTDAEKHQWRQIYDKGVALEQTGDFAAAARRYTAAARIDDTFADLNFRLATCYWNMGRFADAKAQYVLAREHDTLRFRADNRINNIIRTTAAGHRDRVVLLDFEKTLEEHAPDGIAGSQHFYEHVHFNFAGNYLLAKSLFEQIAPRLSEKAGARAADDAPPSESQCARYLAYTEWDRYRLTEKALKEYIEKPPFTNQLYHSERTTGLKAQIAALAPSIEEPSLRMSVDVYRAAIQNKPNDWNLHYKLGRLLTEELKDYPAAAEQFAEVQKCVPHFHRGYTAMGQVLAAQNKINPAINQYMEAIRRYPASADACYHLAAAYAKDSQWEQAEQWYRETLALQARYPAAYIHLAEMLKQQNKLDEAIVVCRRGLFITPGDAILHGNLGILLNNKGLKQEAIKELETALKLEPDSANIRRVLHIIRNSSD